MIPAEDELYAKREQTQVKHYILRHYLQRFAHIVGSTWSSITYVDGFAGPWNVRSPDLADSSFAIGLEELKKARDTHQQRGKTLHLRCFFLEKEPEAYRQLAGFASRITDAEVEIGNDTFERSIPDILRFIRKDPGTFPFLFIDPTGWTGFAMRKIAPLLKLEPGEVLVNFMTSFIRRLPNDEQLADLFGSMDFKPRIAGLTGLELEDQLVSCYRSSLQQAGRFAYALSAMVLHPEIDRTHFHLIYATRHRRGVKVFKETEKRAMMEMERVRAEARVRSQTETGQGSLFGGEKPSVSGLGSYSLHYRQLRERYVGRAKTAVLDLLRRQGRIPYDKAWEVALAWPLVWESDLKEWITRWKHDETLRLDGLGPRQRVPRLEHSHFLIFQPPSKS